MTFSSCFYLCKCKRGAARGIILLGIGQGRFCIVALVAGATGLALQKKEKGKGKNVDYKCLILSEKLVKSSVCTELLTLFM